MKALGIHPFYFYQTNHTHHLNNWQVYLKENRCTKSTKHEYCCQTFWNKKTGTGVSLWSYPMLFGCNIGLKCLSVDWNNGQLPRDRSKNDSPHTAGSHWDLLHLTFGVTIWCHCLLSKCFEIQKYMIITMCPHVRVRIFHFMYFCCANSQHKSSQGTVNNHSYTVHYWMPINKSCF